MGEAKGEGEGAVLRHSSLAYPMIPMAPRERSLEANSSSRPIFLALPIDLRRRGSARLHRAWGFRRNCLYRRWLRPWKQAHRQQLIKITSQSQAAFFDSKEGARSCVFHIPSVPLLKRLREQSLTVSFNKRVHTFLERYTQTNIRRLRNLNTLW